LHQEKEKLGEMHFFRGSFASMKTKIGRNAFVSGGACIHAFGSSFSPEF
jgi:hypothetical protein